MALIRPRTHWTRLQDHVVAILGDAMLDEFLWGDATRISPEAPVPVVLLERRSWALGGAANVAANVAGLGGQALLLSVVGQDEAGSRLRALLGERGIDAAGVLASPDRPTTVKHRVFARNKHMLRYDTEVTAPVGAGVTRSWLRQMRAQKGKLGAVVIADYAKGAVTPELVKGVARFCHEAGIPWCVDPKLPQLRYRGATALKPNLTELQVLAGMKVQDEATLALAAERVLRQQRCQHLLVTRGAQGMALFTAGRRPVYLASKSQAVSDVTGAGDTVSATLAVALAAGMSMRQAAELANLAAGYVVTQPGTAVVERERLREWLS